MKVETWQHEEHLASGDNVSVQQAIDSTEGELGCQEDVQSPGLTSLTFGCNDDKHREVATSLPVAEVAQRETASPLTHPWSNHCGHASASLFCCPLTQAVMQDPVIAADGHTFEREAMQRWLHCHTASPVTGQQLNHLRLVPNIVTRSAIRAQLEG